MFSLRWDQADQPPKISLKPLVIRSDAPCSIVHIRFALHQRILIYVFRKYSVKNGN